MYDNYILLLNTIEGTVIASLQYLYICTHVYPISLFTDMLLTEVYCLVSSEGFFKCL